MYRPKPPLPALENKYLITVGTEEGKTILRIKEFDFDQMKFIDYETEIKIFSDEENEQGAINELALKFLTEIAQGMKLKRKILNNSKP